METSARKIAALLVSLMLVCLFAVGASAQQPEAKVYVTIFDGTALQLTWEEVTVTDTDGDGTLTINDALYAAHEAEYKGGAAAGYASSATEYGLSLNKLWGIDNGGSFGYCLNNASAMSLSDPVKEGDLVYAYAYTDLTAWSDMYTWFDLSEVELSAKEEVTLTLTGLSYDEQWNPVSVPVAGAVITVDGRDTDVVTDAQGKAVISLDSSGRTEKIISARSDSAVLVPPVCVADVFGGSSTAVIAVCLLGCSSAALVLARKKHKAQQAAQENNEDKE